MAGTQAPAARPPLQTIVDAVLNQFAFLASEETPDAAAPGTPGMEGVMTYHGPEHGRVRCWCTPGFARELCCNVLGIDPSEQLQPATLTDAVGEFLNIVCGQLLTSWYGTEAVFSLSPPQVSSALAPDPLPDDCRLTVGEERLLYRHESLPAPKGGAA